jgi:hypothetical protein
LDCIFYACHSRNSPPVVKRNNNFLKTIFQQGAQGIPEKASWRRLAGQRRFERAFETADGGWFWPSIEAYYVPMLAKTPQPLSGIREAASPVFCFGAKNF